MVVEPGTQIGRYEIQRKLGRGGMGTVYVAHDPVLGRMAAIKMFDTDVDVPDAGQRFTREARSAALLNHPNIVTVYDFGEIQSQPYIVMEYVPGEPLAVLIRRKAEVSLASKLRWIEELCSGAGYAHRMSVVHRDIKPANLMIDKSGRLKILDFGIARMMSTVSSTNSLQGTPGYMAPEQIKGEPVDHRADLFAIGVVFYELVALTEAFPGDSAATVMHRVLSDDPLPLDRVTDCHPDIAAICARAMKKDPRERFESADAMRDAIAGLRNEIEADADWTVLPGAAQARPIPSTAVRHTPPPATPLPAEKPTPASARSRTDREGLARRRLELIKAALEDARAELARGRLNAARAACEEALALDETHAEALELEREIEAALAASGYGESTSQRDPASVPPVQPPPARGEAADDDRTVLRVPPADDRTVVTPPRATPAPKPATAAAPTPRPATAAAPASKAPTPGPSPPIASLVSLLDRLKRSAMGWRIGGPIDLKALARARRVPLLIGGAVVVLAIVAAIAMMRGGPVPTGTLIIHGAPWAHVVAVRTADGDAVALPSPATTPLRLPLPAGTYRVTLAGPLPGAPTKRVLAVVSVGRTTVLSAGQFESVSVEDYFERYLDSSSAPEEVSETEPSTSADSAPVAPASTEARR